MTSETEEDDQDPDARDATLMRQLRLAKSRADGALRAELIVGELLARHQPNIRRIVRYRTYSSQPSTADIDEIVNTTMIGVAKALQGDFDPELPFGALVAKNVSWDIADWFRARKRRSIEVPMDGMDFPAPASDEGPSLVDEATRLRELTAGLPERDREILGLRLFAGLDPKRIAEIHCMSRGAVDTATTRALKRLAAGDVLGAPPEGEDVRDSDPPSVERS